MKNKIKSDGDEVTDFYDKDISKVNSNYTCLVIVRLDSALKKDGNYSQVFLKPCKYIKRKVIWHISQDIEIFSKDSDKEQFFTLINI